MMRRVPFQATTGLVLILALVSSGCSSSDEPVWEPFNASTDTCVVEVGAAELLAPVSVMLHSSSGEVEVGVASVDPGGGPVGTEHRVFVTVDDAWEQTVDRASVRTTSPNRGEDEYDLDVDSADQGLYVLTLVSVGDPGEVREDSLTFHLWANTNDDEDPGTTSDTGE
jgi:hypothetical protein